MSIGNDRWAKYGKIGVAAAFVTTIVVGAANLDGFLSMVERLDGSGDSVETNAPTQPRQPPVAVAQSSPPVTTPQQQGQPNTVTLSLPPALTTTSQWVATTPPVLPTRAGSLVVTIRMGSNGKIGPAEYRAGATPGANVDVYDDIGQLNKGCYPSWILTREGADVKKVRNERCTSGGITMFNFNDSLDSPGSYRLRVDIVTDAGQVGNSFVDFIVR